jgi:hypothetical protein
MWQGLDEAGLLKEMSPKAGSINIEQVCPLFYS